MSQQDADDGKRKRVADRCKRRAHITTELFCLCKYTYTTFTSSANGTQPNKSNPKQTAAYNIQHQSHCNLQKKLNITLKLTLQK